MPSSEVAEESSSSSSSEEESSSSLEESSSSEEQESSTSEESEEPSSVFEPIFDHSQFVKKTEVKALLDEMLKSSLPEIVRMVKESLVSQESSDESSESEASEPTESIIKSSAEPEAPAVPPSKYAGMRPWLWFQKTKKNIPYLSGFYRELSFNWNQNEVLIVGYE